MNPFCAAKVWTFSELTKLYAKKIQKICIIAQLSVPLWPIKMIKKLKKEKNPLVEAIVQGMQDKKGRNIVVVDLTEIPDTICGYFVIATGGSPSQIQALTRSVGDKALELAHQKPLAVDGLRYSQWVAMDFAEVIVHILLPEERAYYDIEHLWADAQLTEVPDLD